MDRNPTEWMVQPLRRYAEFGGRSPRAEYWWFWLLRALLGLTAAVLDFTLSLRPFGIGLFIAIFLVLPDLAVGVRRLHDTDRSGWWLVPPMAVALTCGVSIAARASLMLLPLSLALFGLAVLLLVWFCTRGTVGTNRYGPDPLAD